MWTVILSFLKNPKNLIIVILAILVLTCGTVVLFQRASIAKSKGKIELQSAEIENYKLSQAAYQKTVSDYEAQVAKWKKLAENQQVITNNTATVVTKIKYIKSKCTLEGGDAKIINDVMGYFNTGGKLTE